MSVLADPVEMVAAGAPRIIRNDDELAEYTEALFRLTAKDHPTPAEMDAIDLLSLLIESYERRYRLPSASPLEVLKFLMERHGLRQQDLTEELGTVANISMILSGQRNLTLKHALALAARFKVPVIAFLPVQAAA